MESPVVTIKQGHLRGSVQTDIDGGQILSFRGIPYAKPPLGDLRFKAPVPAEPWNGVRDASKDGPRCYSSEFFTGAVGGSEDCLNLNVFTKELPQSGTKLRPVMVWIHGGGFVTGSNSTDVYGSEFLLTQDIVLVTINYRLGVLGFLSMEDTSLEVPGNAGLKDQSLALRWVQENIKSFNGNPYNVTIFGESAGSASVHFQVLSPLSKGLFHKAILQSGCTLNPWVFSKHIAVPLAKLLSADVSDEKTALQVLRSASIEKLYEAQVNYKPKGAASELRYYAPVIEKPNSTAFITKNPIDIITSGEYNKVPLLFGYTSREGILVEVISLMELFHKKSEGKPSAEDGIPWQLGIKRGSEKSHLIARKLQEFYFKGPDQHDNKYMLSTDTSFLSGIMASVENHLQTSQHPVYLYRMSLEGELNLLKKFGKLEHLKGACHGDDLGYLFKNAMTPEIKPGSLEEISIRRFVKLWTNFAKYGNPTPDRKDLGVVWEPVQQQKINFLDIGKELTLEADPEPERMAVWREIYQLSPATAKYL